jgi:ribosomal protein S18 acetylase RimI-like enzyme
MSKRQTRQRWQKMKKKDIAAVEALLQSHERWCMNACYRYLNRRSKKDSVWLLKNRAGDITALMVRYQLSLLPVLGVIKNEEPIPPPHFLRGFLGMVPVHSLQGRKADMLIMEAALEKLGLYAAEKLDYDLMCIDHPPSGFHTPCAGLTFRKPSSADMNALVALHAAYEQEEVLPTASEFSAATSRMNIERIFAKEQIYVAELDGRLIGKINTNATTFTRCQVGGVYVLPEYRGRGIARRMAGEFITGLVAQGRGISLFVKKTNSAARRVYQRIGFEMLGDYRINYH